MSDRIPARARILDAASERFYARGVAATGIDVIIADARVAKMSLYNNFASKADLVSAYLERRHQEFLERHRRRVETLPAEAGPGARALTVFDAYLDGVDDPFRGCGLLNAAGELPTGDAGREAVARHKAEVEDLLRDALGDQALAEHLALLLEGAMVRAGLEGNGDRVRRARRLAADLLGED
jgi:AcrR family transcriptional regulator